MQKRLCRIFAFVLCVWLAVGIFLYKDHTVLIDSEGERREMHDAFLWSETADGVFPGMPFLQYVERFGDEIPHVALGDAPRLHVGHEGYWLVQGGETLRVYDEGGELLAKDITLEDVVARGNSEWNGKTVYICFDVTYLRHFISWQTSTGICYIVSTTLE